MMKNRHSLVAVVLVGFASVAASAIAVEAQVSKQDQACINAMNADFAKLAATAMGDLAGCIKDFSKGKSLAPAADLDACVTADRKGKVGKMTAAGSGKIDADVAKKCADAAPSFGPVGDGVAVKTEGVGTVGRLAAGLFGGDLDVAVQTEATDSPGAKCQNAVVKAAKKCQVTKLKSFNKCKKSGLAGKNPPGTVIDQASLESLCLPGGVEINQLGKNVIDKACATDTLGGIGKTLHTKCAGAGLDQAAVDALFPGVAAGATAAEIERIVECEVCLALKAVDRLSIDCDTFDDGNANGSCGTPAAICGNAVLETGESCDGTELGGETCEGLGFLGGTLACSETCEIDTSGCTSLGAQGAACTLTTDCQPGLFCADGVCCTTACTETCASCGLVGSEGTCTLIPVGQDPDGECPGVSCAGYYWGFAGDTCYARADVSASSAACDGTGSCQTAAQLCPSQGQGAATLTCDALCQDPLLATCSGTSSGTCVNVNPGTTTCGTGICQVTTATCTNGSPNTCVPGAPQTETCNNLDDDCNGITDDGFFADSLEPNDSCSSVRTLTAVGSNQTQTRNTLTIYPSGDNDYFAIPATETDSSCSCCDFFCLDEDFQLSIQLSVPAGAGSYMFCTGESCGTVNSSCQEVLAGQSKTWVWTLDGACPGADDYTRYVRIYGDNSPGFECVPYTLSYSFTPGCW